MLRDGDALTNVELVAAASARHTVTRTYLVPAAGGRVDRLVSDFTGCGRRQARSWLSLGLVRVDGHKVRQGELLHAGQRVEIGSAPTDEAAPRATNEASPATADAMRVIFESDALLAVFKPAAVHTHRGRSAPTAADFVETILGSQAHVGERAEEAGIVHRLDRDTSGVLLVARHRDSYLRLRDAFASGESLKFYLALVDRRLRTSRTIDAALARGAHRMIVARPHERAWNAQTFVQPLDGGTDWTLVLASMRSGVSHQIRAHLALIGHPLLGDSVYGSSPAPAGTREGHLLHAARIVIRRERIDLSVAAPPDFVRAYAALQRGGHVARAADASAPDAQDNA